MQRGTGIPVEEVYVPYFGDAPSRQLRRSTIQESVSGGSNGLEPWDIVHTGEEIFRLPVLQAWQGSCASDTPLVPVGGRLQWARTTLYRYGMKQR